MELEEYDRLLQRANNHIITASEFEAAAAELAKPNPKGDPGKLMAILRRDRTQSYESLMAPYLAGPDFHGAREALIFICLEYGQTARYTHDLLRFMQGVPYDQFDELRRTSIGIAGVFLNGNHDAELLQEMVNIAENATDKLLREEAFRALFEALGHNGVPYGERDINAERERDYEALGPAIIQEAKLRLMKENSNR